MASGFLGFILLFLLVITALALLISRDWRGALAALSVQYFLAFLLITSSWPIELAAVKLVAGWMAAVVLGLSRLNLGETLEGGPGRLPGSPVFLILATALVLVVVMGTAPALSDWTHQLSVNLSWGGLMLVGVGLLQVGLNTGTFRSIVGLLTLLCGFEILYAGVEASLLVAALLAVLNLGIALVGSYLLQAQTPELGQ